MNMKTLFYGAILFAFTDFTAYAIYQDGLMGFWEAHQTNYCSAQISYDLVIGLLIGMVWMIKNAKSRSINPWPYALLTIFLGSIGPLCYLVRHGFSEEAETGEKPVPVPS